MNIERKDRKLRWVMGDRERGRTIPLPVAVG
jgi:hypothetical protein